MANEFSFNQQDAQFKVTTALPAASANNNTTAMDLGAGGNFQPPEFEVEIAVPAIAAHVTVNNITIKLQDSADNSSFADVDPLISTTVPGVGGTGSVAKTVRFRVPNTIRRYIRFNQACSATDDNTGSSVVYTLRF